MKKFNIFSLLIFISLLSSCGKTNPSSFPSEITPSEEISVSEEPQPISESSPLPSEESSNSETPIPSEEHIPSESIVPSEEPVPSESSTPSELPSISEKLNYIPASGQVLPIGNGNRTVTGPKLVTPIDISDYTVFEFNNKLPSQYWSYIQGNNKVNSQGDYYQNDFSFKFSHLYYGLQTPLLTSWKKIEIRIHISQVNNCKDDGVKEDEPIFKIFGYDINGQWIETAQIDQGSITTKTVGNYARTYILNENICYLEIRLNANPCKSSQHYNIGVNKITLKGFQYN